MRAKSKPDLRSMRVAARTGDHSAARALLRLYGRDELAREIKRNLPFSPRVRRAVNALTAGTDTEWEWTDEHGKIHNDLLFDPPPRSKAPRARDVRDD